MLFALALAMLIASFAPDAAAAVRDYAVEASATVQESPPRIDFSWIGDPTAPEYLICRKSEGDSAWTGPVAVLPGTATSWTDFEVSVGDAYEYAFRKTRGIIRDTLTVAGGDSVTFTIRDSWGDGICCENGLGTFEISGCGVVYASGGAFGAEESASFSVGSPENPCGELVVSITLDAFGQETTWTLTDARSQAVLAEGGPYSPPRYGHVFAGIRAPALEDPGTVLLLVEQSVSAPLSMELERLEMDLFRDGYRVRRHDVSSSTPVQTVKQWIVSECGLDPTISTLFLLGHIPVPYSGLVKGAHIDHWGAWPADLYYGELDGEWTDSVVNYTGSARLENHNVPGDGKFDQTFLPSDVDLQVGRVDLSRLPAFAQDEVTLLRRYLDRNHAFRAGEVSLPRRGLIDDNVGEAFGTAYACTGWRNFAAAFGPTGAAAGDWIPTLQQEGHLAAYGCGPSGFTSCGGVASTTDFAARSFESVFTMLMGSYCGDWDNQDNVLRAPLASEGTVLTCCWAGRPPWHMHHMALGRPVGYSARLTQNNWTLYTVGYGGREIHTALMGDPTLRMFPFRGPGRVDVDSLSGGRVRLTWPTPPGAVLGYSVYRADHLGAAFTRISTAVVEDTTFVDEAPPDGCDVYMVRAVRLETTGSGTHLSLSAGAIDSLYRTSSADPVSGACILDSAPNPFAKATEIRYRLSGRGSVDVRIFDARGRLVRRLATGTKEPGTHALPWDGLDDRGRPVPSGTYYLSLDSCEGRQSRKIIAVR